MIVNDLFGIAQAVGGRLMGSPNLRYRTIREVVTDSRTCHDGAEVLFVALVGPANNGHNYISAVKERGGKAFMVSDVTVVSDDAAYILVDDTLVALQQLAAWWRSQFSYPVLAITGSNGKTVVKEWLSDVLTTRFQVVRSPKSYNSQVGVPLSVLQMSAEDEVAVFEAGISEPGEMMRLEAVLKPDIGVFTNLGDAHQQFFQTENQKLAEKLLLFQGCKSLVFRSDVTGYSVQIQDFCRQNEIEAFDWGFDSVTATVCFSVLEEGRSEIRLLAKYKQQEYIFRLPFNDASSIENSCHCLVALLALHLNPEDYLQAFESLQPVAMRLEIKAGINNCLLINDFYNADLHSLSVALSVLEQQATLNGQKKVLILSDIQQTGLSGVFLYSKVNKLLTDWGIDELIGIGSDIARHASVFSVPARFYSSLPAFEEELPALPISNSVVLIKGARKFRFERIAALLQQKVHETKLEINLRALAENYRIFKGLLLPGTKVMVMVKAFSYGSGDAEVARALQHQNVDYLAVAVADEGIQLRNAGISVPIVVMNPTPEAFSKMLEARLEPNLYSIDLLKQFAQAVVAAGLNAYPVHLKLDTGMNRLGLKSKDEVAQFIDLLLQYPELRLSSVFSHLAASDEPAFDDFTHEQFHRFEELSTLVAVHITNAFDRHILNSAGIERFPEKQFEMVRLGIGLYGVSVNRLPLQPIGTFKSTISQVKHVAPYETVGYGRRGKLQGAGRVAIVPVGYADGIPRKLGNGKGEAFVNGERVPFVGNVCMDMLMLDVSDVEAKPGDEVEFFGPHISVQEVADKLETIPYEVLTGISQRVKRVYIQE